MRILIDADACPVTQIAIEIAREQKLSCILFCDTAHIIRSDYAETVTVDQGADSVDFKLVNSVQKEDIVITQDYGLAAMCLARKATVLNQNGLIYTDYNITDLLTRRHENKKKIRQGKFPKGQPKRTAEQDEIFRSAFLHIITKKYTLQ